MNYIDKLLPTILDDDTKNISHRDLKILKSINKTIQGPSFITENQGRLLVKILKDNITEINIDPGLLIDPIWSQPFRTVDKTRKLSVVHKDDTPYLVIEFTFASSIRKSILQLGTKLSGFYQDYNKSYRADLTEENIVLAVEELTSINFVIEPKILEYYNIIKSWEVDEIKEQYQINTISYANFQKQLTKDLGIDTPLDQNIIADRSIRYQYYVKSKNNNPSTLTEIIANRSNAKLWIDSNIYCISEIVASLKELRRLPLLIVFDSKDSKKTLKNLELISSALIYNKINNDVGIYFRLSNNDEEGKEFNQFIADYNYNATLTDTTQIVGVQATKIPKFFITSDWKPMSVISIDHSLKHSKTAIYANCCDLIISYTGREPIIETRNLWE